MIIELLGCYLWLRTATDITMGKSEISEKNGNDAIPATSSESSKTEEKKMKVLEWSSMITASH